MLDILKRSFVSIISGLVIVYMISMMINGAIVVQAEYLGANFVASLGVILVALYLLVIYGVYPLYHPMQKRTLLVLWLLCIALWHIVLLNDITSWVYAGDMLKLFGVLIIWFGATGILSKNKSIQSQKREKHLEIIEA